MFSSRFFFPCSPKESVIAFAAIVYVHIYIAELVVTLLLHLDPYF